MALKPNRSMPAAQVIPVLGYPDVSEAVEWLCRVFGFTVRWRAGTHRAQLNIGDGAMAVTQSDALGSGESVMVRVEDVYAHCQRAVQHGANVLQEPADFPYGERQYTVEDLAGHVWTFSETISDIAPEEWGGRSELL